ncbi:DUF2190 family protein [Vibrio vulnificus]|uniref:DUF2190 family protein n=1 Tax=Vibrio vulnificus TaxID=672 RepID=UPI001FB02685|nr:capsid cement protein [Vibrio vulnificus]MCJ0806656.1 DUF2190 family protein [Vibrio vulnificus]
MAKNAVSDGKTIEFVADQAYTSGAVVEIGALIAVVHENVASGEIGVGHAEGVWVLPKSSAVAIAQGELVYLKNGVISKDNTGTLAGKAWESVEAAVEEIAVKINA